MLWHKLSTNKENYFLIGGAAALFSIIAIESQPWLHGFSNIG